MESPEPVIHVTKGNRNVEKGAELTLIVDAERTRVRECGAPSDELIAPEDWAERLAEDTPADDEAADRRFDC